MNSSNTKLNDPPLNTSTEEIEKVGVVDESETEDASVENTTTSPQEKPAEKKENRTPEAIRKDLDEAREAYSKELKKCLAKMREKVTIDKIRTKTMNIFTKAENALWSEKKELAKAKEYKEEDFYTKEHNDLRKEYIQAKKDLAAKLMHDKTAELEAAGFKGEELEKALTRYKATGVFNETIFDERQRLIDERAKANKNIFTKTWHAYKNMPRHYKVLLTTTVLLPLSTTTGLGAIAAAKYGVGAMFAGKALSSYAIGGLTTGVTAKIFDKVYGKKNKLFEEKQAEKYESLNNDFVYGRIQESKYIHDKNILAKESKVRARNQAIAKAATSIFIGMGAGITSNATIGNAFDLHADSAVGAVHHSGVAFEHPTSSSSIDNTHGDTLKVHTGVIKEPDATLAKNISVKPSVEAQDIPTGSSTEAQDIPTGPEVEEVKSISPTRGIYETGGQGSISPTQGIYEPTTIHDIPSGQSVQEIQTEVDFKNAQDIPTGPDSNVPTTSSEPTDIKINTSGAKDIPTGPTSTEAQDIPTGPATEASGQNITEQSGIKPVVDTEHAKPIPTGTTEGVGDAQAIPSSEQPIGTTNSPTVPNTNEVKYVPEGSIAPNQNIYSTEAGNTTNFSNQSTLNGEPNASNGFTREVPMTKTEEYEYTTEYENKTEYTPRNINNNEGNKIYEVGSESGNQSIENDPRHLETAKDLRKEIGRYNYKNNTVIEKPLDINNNALQINDLPYKDVHKAIDYNFDQNNVKFKSYEMYEREREMQLLFGKNFYNTDTETIRVHYFRSMPEWNILKKIPAKYFFEDLATAKSLSGTTLTNIPQADLDKLVRAGIVTDQVDEIEGVLTHRYVLANQTELLRLSDIYEKSGLSNPRPLDNETIANYMNRVMSKVHETDDGTLFVLKNDVQITSSAVENTDGSVVQSERIPSNTMRRATVVSPRTNSYPGSYSPNRPLAVRTAEYFMRSASSPVRMFR